MKIFATESSKEKGDSIGISELPLHCDFCENKPCRIFNIENSLCIIEICDECLRNTAYDFEPLFENPTKRKLIFYQPKNERIFPDVC